MLLKKNIVILICILIMLLLLSMLLKKIYNQRFVIKKGNKIREELSLKLVGKKYKFCNTKSEYNSYGLLLDAVIVCKYTSKLQTPIFEFENLTENSVPSNFLFVNLDTSWFNTIFNSSNSPRHLCCKTKQAYKILNKIAPPSFKIYYTSFSSIDKFKPEIKKDYDKFIHIAGKSPYKGTINLLKCWIDNPSYPTLTIIANKGIEKKCNFLLKNKNIQNVILIDYFVEEKELEILFNTNGIHICPSEHEGWGHYIHEAKSSEAVVLYTDAPSMNETFIEYKNGIPIHCNINKPTYFNYKNICSRYIVTPKEIQNSVDKLLSIDLDTRKIIGKNARTSYLNNNYFFSKKITNIVKGQQKINKIIHTLWIDKKNNYLNVKYPNKYDKYINTFKKQNEDFNFIYWSGKSILNLISTDFPEYLNFYTNLQPVIKKCDFARFIIIAKYGGVYTDLDFFCKQNLNSLLTGENYFVFEPDEHFKKNNTGLLCNGFFAASSYNKFVLGWLKQMVNTYSKDVLTHTGPRGLYEYYTKTPHRVILGNTCDILPITNIDGKFSKICSDYFNNYISTTWYDGSDWSNNHRTYSYNIINDKDTNKSIFWYNNNSYKKDFKLLNLVKHIHFNKSIFIIGYNIIDVLIPLAISLENINRKDVVIYAAELEQLKRENINTLALMNSLNNIYILNNTEQILLHDIFKKDIQFYISVNNTEQNLILNKKLLNLYKPIILNNINQ